MDLSTMTLSILIIAKDLASPIFQAMGASGIASMGMLSTAALALSAAVAGIGVASIAAATPYDQAMHKIQALTSTNAEQLAYYNQQILALGPSLDMSAADMAKALYYVISAGLDPLASAMDQAKNNIDVLRYSAMAATAGMADQSTIADALTSVLNAYADSNLQAGNAIDVLNTMVSRGKMDWSSFVSTIGIGATTAQAAGVSFNEFSAAMATLSGVVGNHGIRRMSNDLQNLMRSMMSVDDVSKRSAAQLKEMGVTDAATFTTINQAASDARVKFDAMAYSSMSFMQKLQYLAQLTGFKDFNSQRMQAIQQQATQIDQTQGEAAAQSFLNYQLAEGSAKFEKLVGGAAAFLPALTLLQQGGASYNQNLAAMTEKTQDFGTRVTASFNVMRESTGQQLKMLGLSIQNIGVVIGLQLLPYVNKVLEALRGIALAIVGWLSAPGRFNEVATAVKGLAIIVAGPLLMAVLSVATAALPFTMALLGVMAASYLVGKAFEAVSSHWKNFQQFLKDASPLAIALKVALGMLAVYIVAELVVAFGLWAVAAWQAAIATIAATWPILALVAAVFAVIFVITMLVTHWKQVTDAAGEAAGAVGRFFGGVFSALGTFGRGIADALGSAASAIGGFFSGAGTLGRKIADGLGSLASSIGEGIGNAFEGAKDLAWGFLQGLFYFIVGLAVIWWETNPFAQIVVRAFVTAFEFARIAVGVAFAAIGTQIHKGLMVIGAVLAFFQSILMTYVILPFFRLVGWIENLLGIAVSAIGAALSQAGTKFRNFADLVGGILGSIFSAIGTWVHDTWKQFTDWVGGIVKSLQLAGGTAVQAAYDNIVKPIQDKIGELVNDAVNWGANLVKQFIKGITDNLGNFKNSLDKIIKIGQNAFQGKSPPPGWPEQGQYGVTFVKNFVAGIQTSLPQVAMATGAVQGAAVSGLQSSLPRTAMVGSGGNTTVNITANFPDVTDSDQIKQAFDQLIAQRERGTYQKGRAPGKMQGIRAGL